jgi:hypothetical protein
LCPRLVSEYRFFSDGVLSACDLSNQALNILVGCTGTVLVDLFYTFPRGGKRGEMKKKRKKREEKEQKL